MPWISKRELALRDKQVEQLEDLLRVEREKADRLQDQLLLLHGHEPVTPVVRTERATRSKHEQDAFEERQRQMQEIFNDAMTQHEDLGGTAADELREQVEDVLRG